MSDAESTQVGEKPAVDYGKVIAAVIQLRDLKDEITKRQKAEIETVNTKIGKLEGFLQGMLIESGLTAYKSEHGTAFLKFVDSATVQNFEEVLEFVRETGRWEMLKGAVSKEAVKEYIEANGDAPPGVKYTKAQVCQIRRG